MSLSVDTPSTPLHRGPSLPNIKWSQPRVARLGYLIGLGWNGRRIGEDSLINLSPTDVHRQAEKYGLSMREAQRLEMTTEQRRHIDSAATKRGLTSDAFVRYLLRIIASDPILISNIADDGH